MQTGTGEEGEHQDLWGFMLARLEQPVTHYRWRDRDTIPRAPGFGSAAAGAQPEPMASCAVDRLSRVRLTDRALCLSVCVEGPLPSQIMCATNGALSRVRQFIIVRRYT
jgi:hypothetical protein